MFFGKLACSVSECVKFLPSDGATPDELCPAVDDLDDPIFFLRRERGMGIWVY